MCGLAGVVSFSGPVDTRQVVAMAAAIRHRGPDASGLFEGGSAVIAAHRLAITDPHGAGAQPFASSDGRLRLAYNGEVYNHRELRVALEARGHRFRTETDTEMVVAAFREWGEQCVERFEGMWAFALWDRDRETLFCSRDRFGIKPFYYHAEAERLAFASEIKAFRGLVPLRVNPEILRDFLEYNLVEHRAETFFENIHSLLPAHNLSFSRAGLRIARYWRLGLKEPPADPAEAVRERFFHSVDAHLAKDVPQGFCLSGGLDSSSVLCVANALDPAAERHSFTASFADQGIEERVFAEPVIAKVGARPHWITFSSAELVEELPKIVRAQDEPFIGTSIAAEWFVMKTAAAAGRKVMLDGQGADELLGGYRALIGFHFADLLAAGRLRDLGREMAAFRRSQGASAADLAALTFRPFLSVHQEQWLRAQGVRRAGLVHRDLRRLPTRFDRPVSPFPDRLRRRLNLLTERLPHLLHTCDRNSMAHGIETRVPYLDHRLAEIIFSVGGRGLVEDGRQKMVMRRAVGDLLPDEILHRRSKLSFPTPEGRFFREELGAMAADIYASRSFRERGWVNPAACQARLAAHRGGALSAGYELWRMLNAELWAREFLDGATEPAAAPAGPVLRAAAASPAPTPDVARPGSAIADTAVDAARG